MTLNEDGSSDVREFVAMLINEGADYVLPNWEFEFYAVPPLVSDDEWPGCKIPEHIANGCFGQGVRADQNADIPDRTVQDSTGLDRK